MIKRSQKKTSKAGPAPNKSPVQKRADDQLTAKSRDMDQRNKSSQPTSVPPIVKEVLRSPGQPLDSSTRSSMEAHLGHDFGNVRVHTDERAGESASAVKARAYTVGRDIVFGSSQSPLGTSEGKKLLAHELVHVMQQNSETGSAGDLAIGPPDDSFEQEAHQVNQRAGVGVPTHSGIRLQRQPEPEAPGLQTPPSTPVGPAGALAIGQVVNVEVRDASGAVTEYSHEYPIDLSGNIEIPTAGTIAAAGKSLAQLRAAILAAFSGSILVNPTINVSLSSSVVTYSRRIAVGDTVHIRVLEADGKVDPSSGSYTVDSDGKLHIPFLGDIDARGKTFAELESLIETGIRNGFIRRAVVHVSPVHLN